MNKEIKRLLKLSVNPFYKMTPEEEQNLAEWKAKQVRIEVPEKPKRKYTKRKKVENVVTEEQKETGELES